MGYGKFTLYTHGEGNPGKVMQEVLAVNAFDIDETIPPSDEQGWAKHHGRADCSLTFLCVYCGEAGCVGCGQEAAVVFAEPGYLSPGDKLVMPATLLTACVGCVRQVPAQMRARMEI